MMCVWKLGRRRKMVEREEDGRMKSSMKNLLKLALMYI